MQFPETCRSYALQGADMVLAPTWGWESTYAAARAYENGMYVASAMAVPSYKHIEGRRVPSQVISPLGEVITEGPYDGGAVVCADLEDVRDCARYREARMQDLRRWMMGKGKACPCYKAAMIFVTCCSPIYKNRGRRLPLSSTRRWRARCPPPRFPKACLCPTVRGNRELPDDRSHWHR